MFTKFISKKIQEKLKAKERALARKPKPSQDSVPDGFLDIKDIASRTTFVRMCSNKSEVNNILISGGEHDENGINFGFKKTYRKGSTGLRGVAGITEIQVEYKGGYKAIRECVVSWIVPHIDDLDRLTPYFLTVGKTVVVDWGWVNSKTKKFSDQNVNPFIVRRVNADTNEITYDVDQEIFTNPQQRILESEGDYDAIGGQVTNFNYNLRPDGGFDCTTTIISLGASLFKKPIDEDGNSVGTRKIKSTGKPTYTAPDTITNFILNLRNVIMYDVFGLQPYVYKEIAKTRSQMDGRVKSYDEKLIISKKQEHSTAHKNPLYSVYNDMVNGYGILADSKENPNIVAIMANGVEKIMVTWGWFEDQVLNRYLAFKGGSEDGGGIKMTMRSIDTVLDDDGKPISTQDLEFGFLSFEEEDELVEKYNVDLPDDLSEYNAVLKTNSLIRSSPMLYSSNIFSFFTLESLNGITVADIENVKGKGFLSSIGDFFTGNENEEKKKGSSQQEFFKTFFSLISDPNDFKFTKKLFNFKDVKTTRKGKLRNIWMNIEEIQKAFGMRNPLSPQNGQDNVNPPGTFENAINNLLNSLNSSFSNVWRFEIVVDQFDSTNIKIIDTSDNYLDKAPDYTKYIENSHKVQESGIFKFPAFTDGSIVKNQTLEFKIPTQQALTILYGSNKKKGESTVQSGTNFDKLFRISQVSGSENPYPDKFLKDLETANLNVVPENSEDPESEAVVRSAKIGSLDSNPNSTINNNYGIEVSIFGEKYKWRRYYKDTKEPLGPETDEENPKPEFKVVDGELKFALGDTELDDKPFYTIEDNELKLLPDAQSAVNSYLNASSPKSKFDLNTLIPADLGLEIDGTGGIIPGDIVHTDYIQSVYKDTLQTVFYQRSKFDESFVGPLQQDNLERNVVGDFGPVVYFMVVGTIQKVNVSGWTTEVKTRMTLNKLPAEGLLEFQAPRNRPIVDNQSKENFKPLPEVERPFIPVPSDDEDIADDLVLEELEFEDFDNLEDPNFIIPPGPRVIPAPPNRPNIPVPMDEEDILPDEPLDDLDFDEVPIFIPPSYPSTLKLRRAKQEIELKPERVPEPMPPDVPMIDIGPIMSEEEFLTPPDNLGKPVGNFTDTSYDNPEPDPRLKPMQPSMDIRRKPADLDPTSLLDQINKQKHIVVQPKPDINLTKKGEVEKPEALKTPEVQELNWEEPEVVVAAVNDNIKKEQPDEIKVQIIPQQELTILKSTYRGTYEQNQVLYAVREDWRPLYLQANGKPGGAKKDSEGNIQTLLRAAIPKSVRQEFFDKYIENPNKTGETRVNTTNFEFDATPIDNDRLLRTDRSIYWYGEFNPNYDN